MLKKTVAILCLAVLVFVTTLPAQNTYGTPGKYGLSPWAINNQRVASQFNYDIDSQHSLTGGANSFQFPRSACFLQFGGRAVPGPQSGDTIKINDVTAASVETLAQSAPTVSSGQCVISPTSAAYTHYSYHLRSGTCGLVPAMVDLGGSGTVIVDQKFYDDGCTAATITGSAATAVGGSALFVHDISNGHDDWYTYTPTTLSTLATPATRSAVADNTQVISGTATGTWAAVAYYVCVTYVDALGGESPCSATYNFTATVNVALNFAAPAASAGAVGWRAYAGVSYAAAYQLPITSANCTLSTKVTVFPACAMGAAGVFTGPVTTTSLHPGYVVNTYNPVTQSHNAFGYVLMSHPPVGAFQTHYGPFPATGNIPSGNVAVLGTVPLPASFLNTIGKTIQVRGKIAQTGVSTAVQTITVSLGPTFSTGTPTAICTMATSTGLASAAYSTMFDCIITTNATGGSGTVQPDGFAITQLQAGTTTALAVAVDTGTAAITNALNTQNTLYVSLTSGTAATNPAQLMDLHIIALN